MPEFIPKLKSFSICSHKDKYLPDDYCHNAFYKPPPEEPHWHAKRENIFL